MGELQEQQSIVETAYSDFGIASSCRKTILSTTGNQWPFVLPLILVVGKR